MIMKKNILKLIYDNIFFNLNYSINLNNNNDIFQLTQNAK